jgi:hypothetical protein
MMSKGEAFISYGALLAGRGVSRTSFIYKHFRWTHLTVESMGCALAAALLTGSRSRVFVVCWAYGLMIVTSDESAFT